MSKECITHHYACDCRERKFAQIEAENAALRADKERLDWLDAQMKVGYFWEYQSNHRGFIWLTNSTSDGLTSARAAIDAARKEQP